MGSNGVKELQSKAKAIPFEPAGDSSQKFYIDKVSQTIPEFYEELASMPSASNGEKTAPTAVKRLVEEFKSDKEEARCQSDERFAAKQKTAL